MSTSKTKLVITVGGNIEVIFTPPYHCVCEAKQSTKRNLQRHIQGCKDRHPCESIESILRLKLQTTSTFKNKHFSARMLLDSITVDTMFLNFKAQRASAVVLKPFRLLILSLYFFNCILVSGYFNFFGCFLRLFHPLCLLCLLCYSCFIIYAL